MGVIYEVGSAWPWSPAVLPPCHVFCMCELLLLPGSGQGVVVWPMVAVVWCACLVFRRPWLGWV